MVQFAKTAAQKEREKGGPRKPKKELGMGMDIAQVVLPLIASVAGTPLAGAAVSALMEGAEAKLEGGSWKEALMKGLVSGGTGAATAGLAPGADKLAGTAVEVGKGAVVESGKKALTGEVAKKGFDLGTQELGAQLLSGATDTATSSLTKGINTALSGATDPAMKSIAGLGVDKAADAAGVVGDATAKQRFIEHATQLGEMGLQTYQAGQAEAGAKRSQTEAINAQMQARLQGVMDGERHKRQKPRYSGYGSY
jgi:hypothetical protein